MTDRDARFLEQNPTAATTAEVVLPSQNSTQVPPQQDLFSPSQKTSKFSKITGIPGHMQNLKNRLGRLQLFSSFCENPANISFQTQESDEHVLLFLRKAPILNIPWLITTVLLMFVPPLVYFVKDAFPQTLISWQASVILASLYYLLLATYAFVNFVTWYYNVALVTDKRIVDVDFHQLVIKDVAETKLNLVQDVSYNQLGVVQNIFSFGHILIQTAGALDNFEFYGMPHPARIVEIVENLIGRGGKNFYER